MVAPIESPIAPENFDAKCKRDGPLIRALNDIWSTWNPSNGTRRTPRFFRLLAGSAKALNRLSRHIDRHFGRSFHGIWQSVFVQGHSSAPFLLMFFVIFFAVLGPSLVIELSSSMLAFVLLILLGLGVYLAKKPSASKPRGEVCAKLASILTITALLVIFLVFAFPTLRQRGLAASMLISSTLLAFFLSLTVGKRFYEQSGNNRLMLTQLTLLVVVAGATALMAGSATAATNDRPYLNHFALLIPYLLVWSWLADCWAEHLMSLLAKDEFGSNVRKAFRERLKTTELFVKPKEPRSPNAAILSYGFVSALLYFPLHLLLLPGLIVIALPAQSVFFWWAVSLTTSLMILTLGAMYDRFGQMLEVVRRHFLIGGQLVVSVVVILLSLARVISIQFPKIDVFDQVEILLNSSSATVVLAYVAAGYTSFWLYEYWINRSITERTLGLLAPDPGSGAASPPRVSWIKYPYYSKKKTPEDQTQPNGRAVEVFSGGRFVVTGTYRKANTNFTQCASWNTYERLDLFNRLAAGNTDLVIAVSALAKRIRLYFAALNLVTVVMTGALLWWLADAYEENPQVVVEPAESSASVFTFDLKTTLFSQEGEADRKVILLASSGGGTRAALYSASVLHGLARLNRLDDVVLASGVSGGSAALAYFAVHRNELLLNQGDRHGEDATLRDRFRCAEGEPIAQQQGAWDRFMCAMAHPYIDDVLRGSSEFQILMGKSFSHLLAESLERQIGRGQDSVPSIASISSLGLIFNTTLSGHPDIPAAKQATGSQWAGGRLILTNIRDTAQFPGKDSISAVDQLPYVIRGGTQVSISAAAAASANFPPVFPNARVQELGHLDSAGGSYYVTDGGAMENRGMLSLLYALDSALKACDEDAPCSQAASARVAEIYIVEADASAINGAYTSDRGTRAVLSASAQLGKQLISETLERIKNEYGPDACTPGDAAPEAKTTRKRRNFCVRIQHIVIPIPETLAQANGIATHWMLPSGVESPRKGENPLKGKEQIIAMIDNLHRLEPNTDSDLEGAYRDHEKAWESLKNALGNKNEYPDDGSARNHRK